MFDFLLIFFCVTMLYVVHSLFSFFLYIRSEKVLKSVLGFFIMLCCNMLAFSFVWYSGPALLSSWSPGDYLFGNIKNSSAFFFAPSSQSVNNIGGGAFFFSPCGLITAAFEYFGYPWSDIILLLLVLVFVFFPKVKQFIKNIIQGPVPRQSSCGGQGVCGDLGRYLSQFSPPMVRNFTPEQVQNPRKLVECLKDVCPDPGNTRELHQLAALCWGLAYAYQMSINIAQHPQGDREVPEFDDETAHTVTTPEDRPSMVSVAPIVKTKQWKRRSGRLVREEAPPKDEGEEEKAGSSKAAASRQHQGEETEIIDESETTRSLSLSELREIRKDFSRHPGEHILTWLLRCWDTGANSQQLEGNEAKQLGSLSRERLIDRVIGREAQVLSLWRRILKAVKERYPHKEDIVYQVGKWTTMDKGLQQLWELAVLEMLYSDLNNAQTPKDPDEVQCTTSMWRKFVRAAPSSPASTLAAMDWEEGMWITCPTNTVSNLEIVKEFTNFLEKGGLREGVRRILSSRDRALTALN
ncbi:uncharacterized protein [Anas platyrhynchos]|uniref:uncharacterized protein isoform X1 n=1 Tax=Anas platyrhynchos TaxID=8839 RepID=UPI003AF2E2B7